MRFSKLKGHLCIIWTSTGHLARTNRLIYKDNPTNQDECPNHSMAASPLEVFCLFVVCLYLS